MWNRLDGEPFTGSYPQNHTITILPGRLPFSIRRNKIQVFLMNVQTIDHQKLTFAETLRF